MLLFTEALQINRKFKQLAELGAEELQHTNGSLIDHLVGTKKLLKAWGASAELQDAGLYHAVYGTAGFDEVLVSIENRTKIAKIIGNKAEEIVYQYCACDRDYIRQQIGTFDKVEFRNRFTAEKHLLTKLELSTFCELTVANELEIATDNPEFVDSGRQWLNTLFTSMQPYLSKQACNEFRVVLGIN